MRECDYFVRARKHHFVFADNGSAADGVDRNFMFIARAYVAVTSEDKML